MMKYNAQRQAAYAFAIGMNYGSKEAIDTLQKIKSGRIRHSIELPREMRPSRWVYESLGFKFHDTDDEVLLEAELPDGWSLKPNGEYWTYLVDEKDRIRGSYFYKGLFYDRVAHMGLSVRYIVKYRHKEEGNYRSPIIVYVEDTANGECIMKFGEAANSWCQQYGINIERAKRWLKEKFPDAENCVAYWD